MPSYEVKCRLRLQPHHIWVNTPVKIAVINNNMNGTQVAVLQHRPGNEMCNVIGTVNPRSWAQFMEHLKVHNANWSYVGGPRTGRRLMGHAIGPANPLNIANARILGPSPDYPRLPHQGEMSGIDIIIELTY